VKILIAEDDPVAALFLGEALREKGHEVVAVASGPEAWEVLSSPTGPSLAILDWILPGLDGVSVCRRVREEVRDRYVYIIMLTARTGTTEVVRAIEAGMDDFMHKPYEIEELYVRLRAGQRIVQLERRLRARGTHDALTGLFTRKMILDLLERELARHGRDNDPLSVVMADFDHFRSINDRYGSMVGDEVLSEAAARLSSALRPYDSLGRYGGDELMLVLPSCSAHRAKEVAMRMRRLVAAQPFVTACGEVPVTLSLGVATLEGAATSTVRELLHSAENALYLAKSAGRDRVECAS